MDSKQKRAMESMIKALASAGVVDVGETAGELTGDEGYLREVLGHGPRGWWRVVNRGEGGRARVVATYPLWWEGGGKCRPFPNMFWLTDGELIVRISELERVGLIGELEEAMAGDADFRAKVDADHVRYAQLRWAMLDEDGRTMAAANGFEEALRERGVGGLTAGSLKIKCLHAHVADHLVMMGTGGGNEVGERVMGRLG